MLKFSHITLIISTLSFISLINIQLESEKVHDKLSSYGFFRGELKDLTPVKGVIPYDLNTPLFSDYAMKARFMYIPEGKKLIYQERVPLQFPSGTVLIKNFYYPDDFRKTGAERRILETRLLVKENNEWQAYPYIWNSEQTEAYLEVAGGSFEVAFRNKKGKRMKVNYSVPNKNECKGCHVKDQEILPIGPSARQLNRNFEYASGTMNQLKYLESKKLIELPDLQELPKASVWNDPSTGSLDQRARDYLDMNCAHCHNPKAPANTSGLFLNVHENNPVALGINKSPVAAGRGSGNRRFDIVPGRPDESILLYRMESRDPGVMMPEIGRSMVHEEGIALIREWIRKMDH